MNNETRTEKKEKINKNKKIKAKQKVQRVKIKTTIIFIIALLICYGTLAAQERKIRWKRAAPVELDLALFHSTDVINLPTAETLQKGDFQFEISHRFNTPVSAGISELYGFDGSVSMRFALGYGITDRMFVTIGRSNQLGNIDLRLKYKLFQIKNETVPTLIAIRLGGALNGKAENIDSGDKYQYYGQLILNTLYDKKIGFGIVPSYLYNSHIYCKDTQDSFTLGLYGQYYISERWNLFLEFNPTVSGWRDQFNSIATGIELETGGHFFKIHLGNNVMLNPTQYLAGAVHKIGSNDWHFGFNITRLFKI